MGLVHFCSSFFGLPKVFQMSIGCQFSQICIGCQFIQISIGCQVFQISFGCR